MKKKTLEKTSFPNNIPVPENVVGSLENPEDPEVPHDLLQTQRLHEPVPTQHLVKTSTMKDRHPKLFLPCGHAPTLIKCDGKKEMTNGLINYIGYTPKLNVVLYAWAAKQEFYSNKKYDPSSFGPIVLN
jgi:hypothetical protein